MQVNKKKIIFAIILIVLIISGIFIFKSTKPTPQYMLTKIVKQPIIETVEASGIINPVQTVSIGSQVSGMINAIYVDFNSQVKKGQLLAQIDTSLFQAQVDQASATLNSKKADYQKHKSMMLYDKANYQRYKTLYAKHYVAKSELDLADATYKSDTAQLASDKAAIAQAQATLNNNLTNLRYTKIISPVDGVVVSREVDVGQTVAASFQTPTLFSVAQDLTKMQIEVSVSEADIGKVKNGQDVEYSLDGYPNETFKGRVSQVRLSSTTVSNVVTYTVVVTVNNENGILKPGMSANVAIITNKKGDALCVENSAMRYTPIAITKGKKFKEQGIWTLKNSHPLRINIKTGVTDSEFTEIISKEIQEGDDVIIGDLNSKNSKKTNMQKPPSMF